MTAGENPSSNGQVARVFATTRWSVVLQAGGPNSDGSAVALEQLCRMYWYPLYSFARRSGVPLHDAEDLTQAFFAFLLEKGAIARASRERGRFRSFLLGAFKNFQANERAYQAAAKRGGGKVIVSLDKLHPEDRYRNEPASEISPEKLYDQKWAVSLLDQVMQTLRVEYVALGKGPLFDALRSVIWNSRQETSYEALSRQVDLSEGACKVAVHRLRSRYKECLRHEVAQTVASPAEVDDELRHLLAALSS